MVEQGLAKVTATWASSRGVDYRYGPEEVFYMSEPPKSVDRVHREALVAAEIEGGYQLGVMDGRDVIWSVDLAKAAERLRKCEQGWTLLFNGQTYTAAPMKCGQRCCPRCVRDKVGRLAQRWVPVLVAAAEAGAGIYHLTLTQPIRAPPDGAPPALVLPSERARWVGAAIPGEVLPAVSGESLTESYQRFRGHWRNIRQSRRTRARWKHALGGYMYGVEWTLRAKNVRGPQRPRWHCHAHVLAIVPGGWRDFRATWSQLRQDWCAEVPGASPWAQHCSKVTGSEEQDIADALLEVAKYPVKLTDLTLGAQIEAFASLRGVKPHFVGGPLHAASRALDGDASVEARTAEPWRTWLAEAREPPSWPRLRWYNPRTGWEDFTGQVREGRHRFAHNPDDGSWEADAATYWAVLRSGREEQGVAASELDALLVDSSAELDIEGDPDEA